MNVLTEIDVGETADEVIAALESIDVQDCWDRSGNSRDGYTSPEEAAAEIIEEELQPFFDQVERYHEMDLPEQETAYCMGVIFGIYRYERESKSEFRKWSEDIPAECGGFLLDKWRERNRKKASNNAMHELSPRQALGEESRPLPQRRWAKWLSFHFAARQSRTRSTRWTTTSPLPGAQSGTRRAPSSWSAIHGPAPLSPKRETTRRSNHSCMSRRTRRTRASR